MEPFGACHEGIVGAVLADGSEPKPVCLDSGSGAGPGCWTSEWWAYTGQGSRPRAAAYRAACACGWRGEAHPIDWAGLGEDRLEDLDISGPYDEWVEHIGSVERQTVPLPEDVTEALQRLESLLDRLAGQAPVAALKAVAALERLTRAVGHQAACTAEADGLSPETMGRALGVSPERARSLVRDHLRNR
ncbi:hypothetical protein [Streptomyces sp. WAC05374]|uniref:hypothetical protein n=1 Tax=Streptomyces sp. WAC05374 TaxID=2487420 RepID=UPI001F19753A|nr:hypothetical protein [Streptomyces sp. WAC05374]